MRLCQFPRGRPTHTYNTLLIPLPYILRNYNQPLSAKRLSERKTVQQMLTQRSANNLENYKNMRIWQKRYAVIFDIHIFASL